jgi:hypothetical protein
VGEEGRASVEGEVRGLDPHRGRKGTKGGIRGQADG